MKSKVFDELLSVVSTVSLEDVLLCSMTLNVGFAQQSLVISHVRGRVPCMKAAQSSLVCDTYPTRVRDPGPSKMVAHAASDKNRLPPSRAILLSLPPCEKCCNCFLFFSLWEC